VISVVPARPGLIWAKTGLILAEAAEEVLVISPYSSVFHDFDTPFHNLGDFWGA
jgi:hypothetical protein